MRDLVLATIGDQPDIEVVGETRTDDQITELVERLRPDCLILALDESEVRPSLCGFLLGRYPEMKILALAPEKNRGFFYRAFVDIRTESVETSEKGILDALRGKPDFVASWQSAVPAR
jgi:hypothetical protein